MARIGWDTVVPRVREAIEAIAGAPVVGVAPVEGGFSPCFAGRLDLADGRAVFAKAVSSEQNPQSPEFLRRELGTTNSVPASIPAARLLGTVDEGDWVAGVFAFVEGRLPVVPWREDELTAALAAVAEVGRTIADGAVPPIADRLAGLFDGWRGLVAADTVPDEWADRAERLVELEERAFVVTQGDRLIHLDVRADNLLVTPEGEVVIVDWAHTSRGAGWVDVVGWASALELEGGGTPEETLTRWPGVRPTADELLPMVAGLAGHFLHRGGLPAPVGLPTLRAFQSAQAVVALGWLDRLLATDARR